MNLFNFSRVGALDHLEWTYQRAFYLVAFFFSECGIQLRGVEARGVAREGILEL